MVALRFRGLKFASKEVTLIANSGVKTGSALSSNLQSVFPNALSSVYLGAVKEKVQNGFDASTIITDLQTMFKSSRKRLSSRCSLDTNLIFFWIIENKDTIRSSSNFSFQTNFRMKRSHNIQL